MNLTGIILAGGKSSRMGEDKGVMLYQGQPLAQYAINILKPVCSEIIISANNDGYSKFGYQVVQDVYANKGPLGGIYSAMLQSANDYCFIVGCDMPNISPSAVDYLIKSVSPEYNCFVPKHASGVEPLFGIYSKRLLPSILECIHSNALKLRNFLKHNRTLYISFDDRLLNCANMFSNINSKDDI